MGRNLHMEWSWVLKDSVTPRTQLLSESDLQGYKRVTLSASEHAIRAIYLWEVLKRNQEEYLIIYKIDKSFKI